jgi:FKBP-type peptidyl-prolyl cis-trans isomerase
LKTLDGQYNSVDTFSAANRYYDYLGYFPYGSASANAPGSPLDQETGMKVILKNILKNANGKVRIIVPSRLAYGRNGTRLIPSNASIDYMVHAIDVESIPDYEDQSIRKYIASLGFQPSEFEKTSTGIYYKIDALGTGEFLNQTTSFKAAYDLKFLNGVSFQKADSATFTLSGVIPAWQEVIPKIKENGKIRILIPSAQAYGFKGSIDQNTGALAIPPFASLDYEVQVVRVLN